MKENTDVQVVKFANERVRIFADLLAKTRAAGISLVEDYTAQDIGTKIDTAGAGLLIADGSDRDGRSRITGGSIYNIITLAEQFVKSNGSEFIDAGRISVINSIKVNG